MIESAYQRFFGQRFSVVSMWLVGVVMSVMASPAWAQVEELKPPKAKEAPSSPKYLLMGIVIVLVAGVIVAVTLKTKRGHQD